MSVDSTGPEPTPAGLDNREAAQRLVADGPNDLAAAAPRTVWAIALGVVREPMFLLLLACGALYLWLGDQREALMLLGFVVVVVAITFAQERKTERALGALRGLAQPRALVVRGGRRQTIPAREVVVDDVIVLGEGDRVVADAVVVVGENLAADESLLTGESVPVRKVAWDGALAPQPPGGDDCPIINEMNATDGPLRGAVGDDIAPGRIEIAIVIGIRQLDAP